MSKLMIFGGGGFVGKTLTPLLDAAGIAYAAPSSRELDLTSPAAPELISELAEDGDSLLMLSALTPEKGQAAELALRNVQMAAHLLDGLTGVKLAQCIYVSSDGVYPLTEDIIDERTPPAPDRSYGHMHMLREQLMREYFVPEILTIFRPCAIYGNGDTHNAYGIPRFIRSAREKGEIALFGEGEEYRDHLHVEDFARILLAALNERIPGTFNVASGTSCRFSEIAALIQACLPNEVKITRKPRAVPVTHRHMNMAALWRAFPSLTPRGIDAGIRELLAA